MSKLGRNELPAGHTRDDFECFGPVAKRDTEFSGTKLADLGCFKQDGDKDSNKYYHTCVARSKKTGVYYLYSEYGRTVDGAPDKPQFQFTECGSEAAAIAEYEKQAAAKNTKRGQWEKVGSKERYVPRVKSNGETEDLYVVRYMASRVVGLPAAKNICNSDALAAQAAPAKATKTKKSSGRKLDASTRKLFKDLLGGAITYTKSVMVGGTLPALDAINDARDLLQDALGRVKVVGSKVDKQIADPELKKLTYNLYGMIPKAKAQGLPEKDWILSQDNIGRWQDDLDAFETALKSGDVEETEDDDVMKGIPADVEAIDRTSELGKYLAEWWMGATRNRHGHSKLVVHNLWRVKRHGDDTVFDKNQQQIAGEMPKKWNEERPMFIERQKQRPDLNSDQRKQYWTSNTSLMFHGTRAVNVPGIIRENLRFPNQLVGVVINGAMFGPGVYNADDWGKSANYCSVGGSGRSLYAGSSGHIAGRKSFMFANDVILGVPHVAKDAHGYTKPPDKCHSVFGKAGHTSSWGSYGGLQNNEWIIYQKGRIILRYLAEVSWY